VRKFRLRFLIPLSALLIGGLAGAAIGRFLGRELALKEAQVRLSINAASAVETVESYASEARQLLGKMNTSPFSFCSERELAYFRGLVYQSTFVKDAGRMKDGRIGCSAIIGIGALSRPAASPDFPAPDGVKLYFDIPAFRQGNERMVALQSGSSYVVTDFRIHAEGMPTSVHFDVHIRVATGPLIGAAPGSMAAQSGGDGAAILGGTIYSTRCSSRYPSCITASLPIADALHIERNSILTVIMLSALAGSSFGLIWFFLHLRNSSIERQLRRAIARDDLRVVYQPIVDLSSGRTIGAEALARWTGEEGLEVSPEAFIRIAEERGFVGEITRLVAGRALADMSAIIHSRPDFRLSVNVAAADLSDPAFLPMLDAAIERTGVPRQNLAIELTETCATRRESAIETIRCLQHAGHKVQIDDFGTGYSSLSYLSDLAVDAIKIDRSFTRAIGTDSVTVAILPQILAMAEALSLEVIVEGIETPEQAAYFAGSKMPFAAQGWLFGRPVPLEDFASMLAAPGDIVAGTALFEDQTDFALRVSTR
jgi:sensor c-di-GMP phosphodiesterase-like protein